MEPVNFILNVLWLVLGGIFMGIGWCVAGVIMAITIIGLPWARSCFVIAKLAFWPFGKMIVDRQYVQGYHDAGTGPLGLLGNVIWFLFAGWWLALGHLMSAVANFITIIGDTKVIPQLLRDTRALLADAWKTQRSVKKVRKS